MAALDIHITTNQPASSCTLPCTLPKPEPMPLPLPTPDPIAPKPT